MPTEVMAGKKYLIDELGARPCWTLETHAGTKRAKWTEVKPYLSIAAAERRFVKLMKRDKKEGGVRVVSPDGRVVRQKIYGGKALAKEVEIYPLEFQECE